MTKEIFDSLLIAMLESGEGISDILFVPGKPPVNENHGALNEFPIDTGMLSSEIVETIAALMLSGNEPRAEPRRKRLPRAGNQTLFTPPRA